MLFATFIQEFADRMVAIARQKRSGSGDFFIFYGTTENAVKIQIYATITAYCLVAVVREEMDLEMDTYDVLRILNAALHHKDAAGGLAQQ